MNLDEAWCLDHLDSQKSEVMEYILGCIATKRSRISKFQPGSITIFVANEEEARSVRLIPGYNELSWSREQQDKQNETQSINPLLTTSWLKLVLLFFNTAIAKLKSAGSRPAPLHPVSFQYMSDLHLEDGQRYETLVVPKSAPYLILAGDIGCLRNYNEYVAFLAAQCAQFDHVFFFWF